MQRCSSIAVLAAGLCVIAPNANAQVFKCEYGAGRTIYADAPCPRGAKALELPSDAGGTIGDRSQFASIALTHQQP